MAAIIPSPIVPAAPRPQRRRRRTFEQVLDDVYTGVRWRRPALVVTSVQARWTTACLTFVSVGLVAFAISEATR